MCCYGSVSVWSGWSDEVEDVSCVVTCSDFVSLGLYSYSGGSSEVIGCVC